MCRRSFCALTALATEHAARLTFIDVLDADKVRQPPHASARFFNVTRPDDRAALRSYLVREPATHIYIANLPHQHLITAFLLAELCPDAQIVVAKPLDVNLSLIESLAQGGGWPSVTDRIFEHDHYRAKGAILPVYTAFPDLIRTYGRVTKFECYLVEHRTIEEEGRVDALRDGVIFDLATHLFALIHLFFLDPPYPALADPSLPVESVGLRINKVARARYVRCQLENPDAETFAAIDVTLHATLRRSKGPLTQEVSGLMVVGKGVKPSSSIAAGLKGLRFKQELQTRSINLTRNEVNPPLTDLPFANIHEDGFNSPIVSALTKTNPAECALAEQIAPVLTFRDAARKGVELGEVTRMAGPVRYYRPGDTLDSVMAQCVASQDLDHRWLSQGEHADIGYA